MFVKKQVQANAVRRDSETDTKLANNIIDTVREPLVVLDPDLMVQRVNHSFCRTFRVSADETIGRKIYDLGNGQWDIPALRRLLEDVLPDNEAFEDYEVEHDFPDLGHRTMLLNARRIDHLQLILLAIEDITGLRQSLSARHEREDRLRLALEAGSMGAWDWDLDTDTGVWDARQHEICGYSQGDNVPAGSRFFELVHSDDRADLRRVVDKALKNDGEFRHEFRIIRPDGSVRWLAGQGKVIRDDEGEAIRIVGINYDITERKNAERRQKLLTAELNHRVKNMLTTMQAIAAQTISRAESLEEFEERFSERLQALARGHDILVRSEWRPTELSTVLKYTLEPFGQVERISIDCDNIWLTPQAALAFNLIVHELATNAAKYGALSAPDGILDIECRLPTDKQEAVVFIWRERGGPPVQAPRRKGFGSRLIERSARHDLDGSAQIDYRPEGLECVIRFAPNDLFSAEEGNHDDG